MLVPTPLDKVCDPAGRPYFLWDNELTLEEFRAKLHSGDPDERLYWTGVLLRQAKPDDAIVIAGRDAIAAAVPGLRGRLGAQEALWVWLTERWATRG